MKSQKNDNVRILKELIKGDNKFDPVRLSSNRLTYESTKTSLKSPQSCNTIGNLPSSSLTRTLTTSPKQEKEKEKVKEKMKKPTSPSQSGDSKLFKTFSTEVRNYCSNTVVETTQLFTENVKALESMITEIKSQGFDRIRQEIEDKTNYQKVLQNSVNSLENSLRIIKNHHKHCGHESDMMNKENDKLITLGDKVGRDLYFMHKEIPDLKNEINRMNDEISLRNEELRYIRNDSILLDKEILGLKDETKRLNKANSDLKKEKENLKNGITLLTRHINSLKGKVDKQDKNNRDFLNDVSILVNQSFSSNSTSASRFGK